VLAATGVVELYAPTRGIVGTPAYIAPELFAGARASASSDQYAYCVALFAALFGRHPFMEGAGTTFGELIERASEHRLVTPAELGLRGARAQRLYEVLRRGLHPSPAERFQDMAELEVALERAANTRLRLGVVSALVAAALLLGVLLFARHFQAEAPALARPEPVPVPASSHAQVDTSVAQSSPVEAPLPKVHPKPAVTHGKALAPTVQPKRRTRRKQADVRYRDWLKDPF
jgi:serine/threonine protein kinase